MLIERIERERERGGGGRSGGKKGGLKDSLKAEKSKESRQLTECVAKGRKTLCTSHTNGKKHELRIK